MAKVTRACRRLIVFDTICQYDPPARMRVVTQPGELVKALRQRRSGDFQIMYQPEHHAELHLNHVANLVGSVGELVFAIDEIDYFGTAGACDEKLDWLIRYGRHRRVAMVYTARRPAEIPRNLTAQTSEFRIFRLTEPRDVEYMQRLIGPAAQQLGALGQFCHLRYCDSGESQIIGANGS